MIFFVAVCQACFRLGHSQLKLQQPIRNLIYGEQLNSFKPSAHIRKSSKTFTFAYSYHIRYAFIVNLHCVTTWKLRKTSPKQVGNLKFKRLHRDLSLQPLNSSTERLTVCLRIKWLKVRVLL